MIRRPPRSTPLSLHDALPIFMRSDHPAVAVWVHDSSATVTPEHVHQDRKSTRLNSSHLVISYAVFCLKKKKTNDHRTTMLISQYLIRTNGRHSPIRDTCACVI